MNAKNFEARCFNYMIKGAIECLRSPRGGGRGREELVRGSTSSFHLTRRMSLLALLFNLFLRVSSITKGCHSVVILRSLLLDLREKNLC